MKHNPVLLFDFGGVIVDLDRKRVLQSFANIGIDISSFLGDYKQSGIFSLLEQGRISINNFCKELRILCNCPTASDEQIIKAWQSFLVNVPHNRLEMLLKAKQHYSINLLSNTNEVHWDMAKNIFFKYKDKGVTDFFDHIFLSCREGIEKPDPELFERVVSKLNVPANDIIFFDDSEVNCQAARNCGLQAYIAPAGGKWLKYFDNYGKLHLPCI